METKDNLHIGHRNRMLEKVAKNADILSDHEILETLLYFSLPRVDTNFLAHKLLRTFGSLDKVFNASKDELTSISGIGEKTADFILVLNSIYNRVSKKRKESKPTWDNFYNCRAGLKNFFESNVEEQFLVVLADKKFNEIFRLSFNSEKSTLVEADITEIANALALHKPKNAIIAHNHPSSVVTPSKADDNTTMKLNLLCQMYGVNLVDHIIIGKDKMYSYRFENRLEQLKSNANIDDLLINALKSNK